MSTTAEMKLYEMLGVKVFRKMVFALEKLIHRRDQGLNINYHIPSHEINALDAFLKYLFYNGAIHARKVVLLSFYFIFRVIFGRSVHAYDFLLGCLLIKDAYCIMLQRYNMLRITQVKKRLEQTWKNRIKRGSKECAVTFSSEYNWSYSKRDLEVIRKIRTSIEKRETLVLSNEDVETLKRLSVWTPTANMRTLD